MVRHVAANPRNGVTVTTLSLSETIARQAGQGRLRTLIIGAGVSGLTLAALLRRQGESPILIERSASFGEGGYNIGLFPLGSRVLHGLGLFPRFLNVSTPLRYYELGNGHGERLHRFDFGPTMEQFGAFQGLRRHELLDLLWSPEAGAPIFFSTRATAVENRDGHVHVTFSDGTEGVLDLVVAADGMHSETRKQLLEPSEYAYHETEWACWVAWAPKQILADETMAEFWGAGRMLGVYPVKDQQGVVLAGPTVEMQRQGRDAFVRAAGEHLGQNATAGGALAAVAAQENPFFWDLHDCRASRWVTGRVVLLGDAAAGFLPTAGVGASMAMLSAAALADELSRTDAAHLPYALNLYERRNKPRVEAAQDNSRRLGKFMFLESAPVAWGRDQLLRLYTLDQALKDIVKVMEGAV